ncbi:MAG: DNA polymerase, partial [Nanoarchaeota archaeon]|nr:DNA polymerase [Nanoarchaeota archaeon]
MLVSVDCETYHLYNGTKESEEFILNNSLEDSKEYFMKNKKAGFYYPILNGRGFTIGAVLKDNCKKPVFFTKPDDMFNYLLDLIESEAKRGHQVFIYAHNHFYDLCSYAQNHLHKVDLVDIKVQKPIYGYLGEKEDENGEELPRGYLLDTMSFYKTKLENIGEMLGYEKLDMPKRVQKVDDLKQYLTRDVEIVMKAIQNIRDTMGKISHKPKKILTAGNLAMGYFKRWCNKKEYGKYKYSGYLYNRGTIWQSKYPDFVRKAYRGARCERFNKGTFENVTMLDINSLYPYILAEKFVMPDLKTEKKIIDPEFLMTHDEILKYIGVCHATVKFPTKKLMYLPTKGRNGFGIYFPPSTTVKGYWTTFELKRALEEGYVIEKIHECVIYEKNLPFNPFNEFMHEMYDLRLNSEDTMKPTIKLLMNALGGKFAQVTKLKDWKRCHRADVPKYEEEGYYVVNDHNEEYILAKDVGEVIPKFSHPIITTYMTALAKDYLYSFLKQIQFDDLLYCDTDSVAFKGNYVDKFEIGNQLGEWKVEYKNAKASFVKEKIYSIEDNENKKVVFAGNSNRDISEEQLWGKTEINNRKMYSLNMAMKTGKFEKIGTFFEEHRKVNA